MSGRSDFGLEPEAESKPVEVARGEPLPEQDRRLDVGEALGRSWEDWLTSPVVGCILLSWYGVLVIALGNLLEDWIAGGSEGEQVRERAGEGSPGAG